MSAPASRRIGIALALVLALLVQMVFADAVGIRGAHPDFVLLTVLLGALFCDANQGAQLGFWGGLAYASIVSPPHGGFGSLIISRTLAGFGVGWLEERIFRDHPVLAVALTAGGTALTEAIFFVFAPQPHALHWARAAATTTLYNAALAGPLYLLMRRLLGRLRDRTA